MGIKMIRFKCFTAKCFKATGCTWFRPTNHISRQKSPTELWYWQMLESINLHLRNFLNVCSLTLLSATCLPHATSFLIRVERYVSQSPARTCIIGFPHIYYSYLFKVSFIISGISLSKVTFFIMKYYNSRYIMFLSFFLCKRFNTKLNTIGNFWYYNNTVTTI